MNPRLKAKYNRQEGRCCYCSRFMPIGSKGPLMPTQEHLIRRCEKRPEPFNIVAACLECNSGRGDTDWLTYKTQKEEQYAA